MDKDSCRFFSILSVFISFNYLKKYLFLTSLVAMEHLKTPRILEKITTDVGF